MSGPYTLLTKWLLWVAALCLIMGPLVLHAQNSSAKRVGILTERQKVAALQEAKRLGLKAESSDKQGKFEESERLAERALVLEEQVRGPWHIDVASRLDHVADLYTAHKKQRAAEPLYERARAIREEALSKHPDVYERDGRNIRIRPNQPAEKAADTTPASGRHDRPPR
jgi:tetratricopeptide (TPR) repeat protein